MSHIENYLRDLRDARSTGEAVKETSFYPALSNLLNGIGAELNPKVRAVINLKNRGAGLPDGGLFTFCERGKQTEIDRIQISACPCGQVKCLTSDLYLTASVNSVYLRLRRNRERRMSAMASRLRPVWLRLPSSYAQKSGRAA